MTPFDSAHGRAARPADETVRGLREGLRSRAFSAVELTRSRLARIEARDPRLHAFLHVNAAAEAEAEECDRALARGDGGPLAGIPVAIKDNLNVADLPTTCGSRILGEWIPTDDATAVARLRRAGAVILGKTNLDEFAMGSSTETSAFGPTRNPWDPERVPGGSSGGSAAAVAAGMVPAALGSDTGGSVRQPAAFCGVVGLKPTYGRVSRYGLVAFGSSLDQVGPLALDVRDTAELLSVLAGADPRDATSTSRPADDWTSACERGVRGLRVGLAREHFASGLDPAIAEAVRAAARTLEREGAAVEEISLPHSRYAVPTYYLVATAEASSNLARFDGVRYGRRATADNLGDLYRETRGSGFGAEVDRRIMLGTYALSAGYYEAFYGKAQRVRTLLRRDFECVFEAGIDVVLGPVSPVPPFRLGEKIDDPVAMYLTDVYTATANLAGLPALAVPVGRDASGLPVGVQLTAPAFAEATLFRFGVVLETTLAPVCSGPPS